MNAIYLPMAFLSGSFWSPHAYPRFLEVIADILPLTYFIRLMRDVVLRERDDLVELGVRSPSSPRGASPASSWRVRVFRWEPREG